MRGVRLTRRCSYLHHPGVLGENWKRKKKKKEKEEMTECTLTEPALGSRQAAEIYKEAARIQHRNYIQRIVQPRE